MLCQSTNSPNRDSRCRDEVWDGSDCDTCLGVARISGSARKLVAPDYPGFGLSDWPDPKRFAYTFDHFAEIMARFTDAIGIRHYALYMQDNGGPVGFRMALTHPERVEALIIQNAAAHKEGLGANWKTRRAFLGRPAHG